jgi:hypothetical protein
MRVRALPCDVIDEALTSENSVKEDLEIMTGSGITVEV